MKNTLKLSFAISVLLFLFQSFTIKSDSDFVGDYGDEIMKLTLNENHTFTFKSSFDSENKINQKGTWRIKRGKVILNSNSTFVPTKWKLRKEGNSIKARRGMVFYTLHKK